MKWKVLKFGTEYVDVNRLHSGIYTTHHPVLHEESITIDGMIEVAKNLQSILGWSDEQVTAYSENIKRCSLVEVALSESPSPSLQEAAEAYAVGEVGEGSNNVNDPFHPQYKILNDAWVAGWNAREAQQPAPFNLRKEIISDLKDVRDRFQWTWDNMNNAQTSDHFNNPANGIEMLTLIIDELSAQQTGPILTRELHDKIWEGATNWAYEVETNHYPDQETFWKSLNL